MHLYKNPNPICLVYWQKASCYYCQFSTANVTVKEQTELHFTLHIINKIVSQILIPEILLLVMISVVHS